MHRFLFLASCLCAVLSMLPPGGATEGTDTDFAWEGRSIRAVVAAGSCSKHYGGIYTKDHKVLVNLTKGEDCLKVAVTTGDACLKRPTYNRNSAKNCQLELKDAPITDLCDAEGLPYYFYSWSTGEQHYLSQCSDFSVFVVVRNYCETEVELMFQAIDDGNVVNSMCDVLHDAGDAIATFFAIVIVVALIGTFIGVIACCACCHGCPLYGKLCCRPYRPPPPVIPPGGRPPHGVMYGAPGHQAGMQMGVMGIPVNQHPGVMPGQQPGGIQMPFGAQAGVPMQGTMPQGIQMPYGAQQLQGPPPYALHGPPTYAPPAAQGTPSLPPPAAQTISSCAASTNI